MSKTKVDVSDTYERDLIESIEADEWRPSNDRVKYIAEAKEQSSNSSSDERCAGESYPHFFRYASIANAIRNDSFSSSILDADSVPA